MKICATGDKQIVLAGQLPHESFVVTPVPGVHGFDAAQTVAFQLGEQVVKFRHRHFVEQRVCQYRYTSCFFDKFNPFFRRQVFSHDKIGTVLCQNFFESRINTGNGTFFQQETGKMCSCQYGIPKTFHQRFIINGIAGVV